jgi:hypothetical protein
LRLIAYLNGWYDLSDRDALARRWVIDAFNLGTVDKAQLKRDADRAKRQARDDRRHDETELARNRGRAMQAFIGAADLAGTVAEIYLRRRGIDFSALPEGPRGGSRRPGYLRFIDSEKHTDVKGRGDVVALHDCLHGRPGDGRDRRRASHLAQAGRLRQGAGVAAAKNLAELFRPGAADLAR